MTLEGVGGAARIRTGDGGFADLCLTTWLRRQPEVGALVQGAEIGAGNGIRTRDFDLGKVALYH